MIEDPLSEAATGGVLLEKAFLEISQNSQEKPCAAQNTFFTEHLRETAFALIEEEVNTVFN